MNILYLLAQIEKMAADNPYTEIRLSALDDSRSRADFIIDRDPDTGVIILVPAVSRKD